MKATEGFERRGVRTGEGRRPSADCFQVNASLEVLKACRLATIVQRDDFAIEHDGLAARASPVRQRVGNFRKLRRLVVAEPRPQPDRVAAGADLDNGPDAVVFRLVDEGGIDERRVFERRQHRLQHEHHSRAPGTWDWRLEVGGWGLGG